MAGKNPGLKRIFCVLLVLLGTVKKMTTAFVEDILSPEDVTDARHVIDECVLWKASIYLTFSTPY